jgi:hypothetical protein
MVKVDLYPSVKEWSRKARFCCAPWNPEERSEKLYSVSHSSRYKEKLLSDEEIQKRVELSLRYVATSDSNAATQRNVKCL